MKKIVDRIFTDLEQLSTPERKRNLMRYFKTGPGEYGEGDHFIGVAVPDMRLVAKSYTDANFQDVETLLASEWHEVRMVGLMILVNRMGVTTKPKFIKSHTPEYVVAARKEIYDFYIAHTHAVNNWDLVDLSAHEIVGTYLHTVNDVEPLTRLAKSSSLWEQRIAMVATYAFIRADRCKVAFHIAEMLLHHKHDLIHKAVGWMLREAGKRDGQALRQFLEQHYRQIPRTTLRYAIERFAEDERKKWLNHQQIQPR